MVGGISPPRRQYIPPVICHLPSFREPETTIEKISNYQFFFSQTNPTNPRKSTLPSSLTALTGPKMMGLGKPVTGALRNGHFWYQFVGFLGSKPNKPNLPNKQTQPNPTQPTKQTNQPTNQPTNPTNEPKNNPISPRNCAKTSSCCCRAKMAKATFFKRCSAPHG